MQKDHDEKFMQGALHLARRGLGTTSPNPAVGAVIVQEVDGVFFIVGRGVTGVGGIPHGEPQAIGQAGNLAQDATLYVTLEPCNHHGRTPPCTEAILKAGIKRVVVGSTDLDERVKGRGLKRLEDAGLEVVTGVCREDADRLNKGHFLRTTENRPYIIVKMAVSSNGLVATASDNTPTWVTSPLARMRGHMLRAESDAILIGRKTAENDNPTLTCRLNGLGKRSPQPIIIDQNLSLPETLTLFNTTIEPSSNQVPWVITSTDHSEQKMAAYKKRGCELLLVEPKKNQSTGQDELEAKSIAHVISEKGITRLLIEGGPTTAKTFLESGIVDQVNIFKGASELKEDGMLPFSTHSLSWLEENCGFELHSTQELGSNTMEQYLKT